MRHLFYFLLGIVAIFASFPALAQSCFPRAALVESLATRFHELPRLRAMTSTGPLVEMMVAPSGSWTLFLTRPDGLSCPIAEGHGVEFLEPVEGDPT